jgi:folylpolyglutamate synthase/dihydropteroate synthase
MSVPTTDVSDSLNQVTKATVIAPARRPVATLVENRSKTIHPRFRVKCQTDSTRHPQEARVAQGRETQSMNYDSALARIGRALQFGIDPSLEPVRDVCRLLGDPQKKYRVVQVGGTNGKTSVARMCSAILSAAGLHVGHYLSPHLETYTERMVVDGVEIGEDELGGALGRVLPAVEEVERARSQPLTEFELLTVTALQYFADRKCDVAVLEVGLGGRWDATTVCDPDVAVLTTVGLDHCDRLGPDEASIAREKAEIVKPGGRLVLGDVGGEAREVILAKALDTGVPVRSLGEEIRVSPKKAPPGHVGLEVHTPDRRYLRLELACDAPYQRDNAALAIAAAEWLSAGSGLGAKISEQGSSRRSPMSLWHRGSRPLDPAVARTALANLTFPGRMERLSDCPTLVIDGAHNVDAAVKLAEAIRHAFAGTHIVMVLGIMADKDVAGIVRALAPLACTVICTRNENPRALDPVMLAEIVRRSVPGPSVEVIGDIGAACERAIHAAGTDGVAFVTGSLYTAGEARAWWRREGHRSCAALC